MNKILLGTFGLAAALAFSAGASAQMHHDGHRGPPPKVWKDNYGSWDAGWGARPAAPPRFWTRKGDWYRHVHACQVKYRATYNPRTDTYRLGKRVVRCKL
ncbi:MAG: hypothetical protein J7496_12605 [Novosphingobium sp.]|nr:hypothetical protein [Novosphingobium sp.]MBO9603337.1 hypothetical protein [Novosphingobium sp.]